MTREEYIEDIIKVNKMIIDKSNDHLMWLKENIRENLLDIEGIDLDDLCLIMSLIDEALNNKGTMDDMDDDIDICPIYKDGPCCGCMECVYK